MVKGRREALSCQAKPMGDRGRFPATGDPQFGEDPCDVNADGPRGDEQCLPDLAIGQPGRHECEHFGFAAGQAEGCRRGG
jgi:hypothetical protein